MLNQDPIVLQIDDKWHIVEHSRHSTYTTCGKHITNRGAHAQFSMVGEEHICVHCLRLFRELNPQTQAK